MSDETGKCRNAKCSIGALDDQQKEVQKQLNKAEEILRSITKGTNDKLHENRILFVINSNKLPFFIDFRIVSDGDVIEGAIIYGVLRKPCYPNSLLANINKNEIEENKPLICLYVTDNGKISVKGKLTDEWWLPREHDDESDNENKNQSAAKSEGKDTGAEKAIKEMHYRVLACIYHDALNWINEPFLP